MCLAEDGEPAKDGRLPLRWGVILVVAASAGLGVGVLEGTVAGIGVSIAAIGLLSQILGS